MRITCLGVNSAFATGKYEVSLPVDKLDDFVAALEESPVSSKEDFIHQLKDFANRQNQINSILWTHREQDAPDKNKKRQQWTCTSTTGVILEL